MSYFVIIRGPLGSGKSTISQALASRLNAKYIPIDIVLEENGLDKVEPDAECVPAGNFIKANEIVIPEVRESLRQNVPVIFDACFYHPEIIDHLIDNLDYPSHVFTLKAPVEVCIDRDSKRDKTHGEGAARAVHSLVSRFDYGTLIDVSRTFEETMENILDELKE